MSSRQIFMQIIGYVSFSFIGYLLIGLPLAILPIFITKTLGFTELVAGIVISLQYVTTFILRGYAGKIVDTKGPKPAVLLSMSLFILAGVLLYFCYFTRNNHFLSLAILVLARLVTGAAEGMVGGSPINWVILKIGQQHTAKAISYNGVASYGALAIGAPLGVILNQYFGLGFIGLFSIVCAIIGYFLARIKENILTAVSKVPQPFISVLKTVAPFGICLALAGLGFGGISNFITLYYDFYSWSNAALCLSVFSLLFIVGRLFFNSSINTLGGLKVGIICMIVETIGLLILFSAPNSFIALIGAGITGIGFSLVFPAMGVEAVALVSDNSKGAALAAYGLFIDISLGITGPLIGGVISLFGMSNLFGFCSLFVFIGLLYSYYLQTKKNRSEFNNSER
ncbi:MULTISPECIES: MFS transporter [unclassified Empedobacter]|uniref:MFS transporter n=1 Tax=unclassified Empedobacter TaxID=2643773 RepID=UPI0025BEE0B7|nr:MULTISPECIES: MFS transporter [unclassified Empedobacter]